jgi:molecular chaperone HscB
MSRCPFETLGVEPRFDLDIRALEQNHRALSRTLHPDRHTAGTGTERRLALSHAIDVNDALRVLKDPVRRAEALFARLGVAVGEGREPQPSQALLLEMMESREELADAARRRDLPSIRRLAADNGRRRDAALATLAAAFEARSKEALDRAIATLGELRYAKRFAEEAAAFEEALEDATSSPA